MTPPEPAPESASPDVPLPSAAATLGRAIRMTAGPWAWLLRAAALASFLAAVTGVLVAPGLRGLAADRSSTHPTASRGRSPISCSGCSWPPSSSRPCSSRAARARNLGNGIAVSIAGLDHGARGAGLGAPAPDRHGGDPRGRHVARGDRRGAPRASREAYARGRASLMLSFAMAALLRIFAWDLARMAGDMEHAALRDGAGRRNGGAPARGDRRR